MTGRVRRQNLNARFSSDDIPTFQVPIAVFLERAKYVALFEKADHRDEA